MFSKDKIRCCNTNANPNPNPNPNRKTRIIGTVLVALFMTATIPIASAQEANHTLINSEIEGYYPYMRSIGTLMYRVMDEGNRGVIDENGRRLPTVGSIIGFNDLNCQSSVTRSNALSESNIEQVLSRGEPTELTEQNDNILQEDELINEIAQRASPSSTGVQFLRSDSGSFFDFADQDKDDCFYRAISGNAAEHEVRWYILDSAGKPIENLTGWQDFTATEITNTLFPNSIIPPRTFVDLPAESQLLVNKLRLSGNYTSSLRVPAAAVGKYIGVTYLPVSQTGVPNQGKLIKLWDLRSFFGQQPPSDTGFLPFEQNDGVKLGTNDIAQGSGGGIVQAEIARPRIENLVLSGILAPGQTIKLAYDFIPNINNSQVSFQDVSVFFWGQEFSTIPRSEVYDETRSFEENQQIGGQDVKLTMGKSFTVELADVGRLFEITALPLRKDSNRAYPVAGKTVTQQLDQFNTLIPLQRPNISSLVIEDVPTIGRALQANYIYTPSNSLPSYDQSLYRWSYDKANASGGVDNIELQAGEIKSDPAKLPDYSKPVQAPNSPILSSANIGSNLAGLVVRLRIDAKDAAGLTGNWMEATTASYEDLPNNMYAIKLVEYDYGGTFPIIKPYGKGYPSTGFAGATFRLFAENLDITTNQQRWNWKLVKNSAYATVDQTGKVTLLKIPPKDAVIHVIAKNKANPMLTRSHSFTLSKWLITYQELSGGAASYTRNGTNRLCVNMQYPNSKRVYVPTVADYTMQPADPNNPKQSLGANDRQAGIATIYRYPSENFYSQWGQLSYYHVVNPQTGELSNQYSFPEANTTYAWTRSIEPKSKYTIYASPGGWADWFASKNTHLYLNAACIVYQEDFTSETLPEVTQPMSAIKLMYPSYPKNLMGFPTQHEYAMGYPTLGFNGAQFVLFADTPPATANQTKPEANKQWRWRLNGGVVATANVPAKNAYLMLEYNGKVTLLANPPRDMVFEITAQKNGVTKMHTFRIKKWLLTPKQVNNKQVESYTNAHIACGRNGARLPLVWEHTSVPVDPKNSERSLGANTREPGWNTIYDFPSESFYSQWGQFNVYTEFDPITGKETGQLPFPTGFYYWTSSMSAKRLPIFSGVAGWGDWFSDTNVNNKRFVTCILDK